MGCEIEIKAHVEENQVESVKEKLSKIEGCTYLGTIDKEDIYWAHQETDPPVFRTRKEAENGIPRILFTSKPLKTKEDKTEVNIENEFVAESAQWEGIIGFVEGLDFKVCRRKWKRGFHYMVPVDGMDIHAELLYVRHLGWFLEIEICGDDIADFDRAEAESALFKLIKLAGLKEEAVEAKGYNKMLKDIGRNLG